MKKLIFLLFFFAATLTFAQQKYALVIGNSNYTGISHLNNPINDANDMALTLQNLGFTVDKIIDGDLEKMETAVINLKRKLGASRNSYGFFFYAGHGVQANGQNYLIPLPATNIQNETHLRDRAVSLQFVLDSLSEAGNELNMIVLDACRDNPFGWSRSGARGLSVVSQTPSGSIVMYAAASGQKADDGTGRNGLFTGYLLKNLKTTGLSVYEVFDKTMGDVKNVTGGKQDPELSLRFSGANSVYLGQRPNTPTPTPETVYVINPDDVVPPPGWQGSAAIASDSELPRNGYYIATNIFAKNETVDIYNLETGKSTRVTVANGLSNPGLLAIVSREAAELIGMRANSVTKIHLVKVTSTSNPPTNLSIIGVSFDYWANRALEKIPSNTPYQNVEIYSIPEYEGDYLSFPYKSCVLILGTSKVQKNAEYIYNKIKNAGYNPIYKKLNDYTLIVIEVSGNFQQVISSLGNLGFREVFIMNFSN